MTPTAYASRKHFAVFVDRDGTLGPDTGYVTSIQQFELYPFTAQSIRKLNLSGVKVIMVTNQSAIARGICSEELVRQVNQRVVTELERQGATLDAVYYCPHHPEGLVEGYNITCDCRKPGIGMALEAAKEFDLDLERSFVIGDKAADIQLAQNFGGKGVLVLTGLPHYRPLEKLQERGTPPPWAIAENLIDAVDRICIELDQAG